MLAEGNVKATFEMINRMQAEAIALRTGRAKDHIRILQFVEQNAVNREKLQSVLERYGLTATWEQFERKYGEGTHE